MLSVTNNTIILNVIVLSVVMLNVVMLNVVMLSVVMLNVVAPLKHYVPWHLTLHKLVHFLTRRSIIRKC